MNKQKVSVCVPAYNREKYIERTIRSILDQTYADFELVISDNASTDGTVEKIREFNDPRIRLITHSEPISVRDNFNCPIEASSGELIAIYHSDDVYEPTIIEEEVSQLDKHPELGAVFTDGRKIDQDDKYIGDFYMNKRLLGRDSIDFNLAFSIYIEEGRGSFICPSVMMRRQVYYSVGLLNKEFRFAGDHELYFRILEKYPVKIIDKKLINYRVHDQQDSKLAKKKIEPSEEYKIYDKFLASPALTVNIDKKILKLTKLHEKADLYLCAANAIRSGKLDYAIKLLASAVEIHPDLFDMFVKFAIARGFIGSIGNIIIKLKG